MSEFTAEQIDRNIKQKQELLSNLPVGFVGYVEYFDIWKSCETRVRVKGHGNNLTIAEAAKILSKAQLGL